MPLTFQPRVLRALSIALLVFCAGCAASSKKALSPIFPRPTAVPPPEARALISWAQVGGEARRHAESGRLLARPRPSKVPAVAGDPGTYALGLRARRDGLLHVPRSYKPGRPASLLVAFHGAGGDAKSMIALLKEKAEKEGVLVLATESVSSTWDMIARDFGPDVSFLEQALASVFARYSVDPTRIAVTGFSDGASYALSLGIANGDLFGRIIAFSPGYASPPGRRGSPRIFISHGKKDSVLPIDASSRVIVRQLRKIGYQLEYREFDGSHTVPSEMIARAPIGGLNST